MADKTYIGKGKVYAKVKGASAELKELGNCSSLTISIQEEVREIQNYQVASGGTLNEVRQITGAEIQMSLHEILTDNLDIILRGSSSADTGAAITTEAVTGYADSLSRLAHSGTLTSVTVTGSGGTPTYVADTDYEVRNGGIYVLSTGSISNGTALEVDYTYATTDVIEAMFTSAQEYVLFFDGLNEAQSGKPFQVDVHRCRFGVGENFGLIQDDFAEFSVTGKALADTDKGSSVSQYFKITSVA